MEEPGLVFQYQGLLWDYETPHLNPDQNTLKVLGEALQNNGNSNAHQPFYKKVDVHQNYYQPAASASIQEESDQSSKQTSIQRIKRFINIKRSSSSHFQERANNNNQQNEQPKKIFGCKEMNQEGNNGLIQNENTNYFHSNHGIKYDAVTQSAFRPHRDYENMSHYEESKEKYSEDDIHSRRVQTLGEQRSEQEGFRKQQENVATFSKQPRIVHQRAQTREEISRKAMENKQKVGIYRDNLPETRRTVSDLPLDKGNIQELIYFNHQNHKYIKSNQQLPHNSTDDDHTDRYQQIGTYEVKFNGSQELKYDMLHQYHQKNKEQNEMQKSTGMQNYNYQLKSIEEQKLKLTGVSKRVIERVSENKIKPIHLQPGVFLTHKQKGIASQEMKNQIIESIEMQNQYFAKQFAKNQSLLQLKQSQIYQRILGNYYKSDVIHSNQLAKTQFTEEETPQDSAKRVSTANIDCGTRFAKDIPQKMLIFPSNSKKLLQNNITKIEPGNQQFIEIPKSTLEIKSSPQLNVNSALTSRQKTPQNKPLENENCLSERLSLRSQGHEGQQPHCSSWRINKSTALKHFINANNDNLPEDNTDSVGEKQFGRRESSKFSKYSCQSSQPTMMSSQLNQQVYQHELYIRPQLVPSKQPSTFIQENASEKSQASPSQRLKSSPCQNKQIVPNQIITSALKQPLDRRPLSQASSSNVKSEFSQNMRNLCTASVSSLIQKIEGIKKQGQNTQVAEKNYILAPHSSLQNQKQKRHRMISYIQGTRIPSTEVRMK